MMMDRMNGATGRGGACAALGIAHPVFSSSSFVSNTAGASGGALFAGDQSTISAVESDFRFDL